MTRKFDFSGFGQLLLFNVLMRNDWRKNKNAEKGFFVFLLFVFLQRHLSNITGATDITTVHTEDNTKSNLLSSGKTKLQRRPLTLLRWKAWKQFWSFLENASTLRGFLVEASEADLVVRAPVLYTTWAHAQFVEKSRIWKNRRKRKRKRNAEFGRSKNILQREEKEADQPKMRQAIFLIQELNEFGFIVFSFF